MDPLADLVGELLALRGHLLEDLGALRIVGHRRDGGSHEREVRVVCGAMPRRTPRAPRRDP